MAADDVDADKPIARLALDTRSMGPIPCEQCDEENEDALLMEDGAVVCPECRTPYPAFEQFSSLITSVSPAKLKGAGHVCGDHCRARGCKYGFPEEDEG